MPKTHICDPDLFNIDLSSKTIIVTGANSGIGRITTEQLLKQGAQVILACRRTQEADKVLLELGSMKGKGTVLQLDLGDLSSVREFARSFKEQFSELHVLVNNAGVMATDFQQTTDGFEMQIGVNHFGHFLLTELLLDRLIGSAPSRIVTVSSAFHDIAMGKKGHIDLNDINFEKRDYHQWTSYAQSKLANVLHSKELGKRLEGTGVSAVSLHPGWVRTNLAKNLMPLWIQNYIMRPFSGLIGMIEPWEGAQTSLHCILEPNITKQTGKYFSQFGAYSNKAFNRGGWPMESPNPEANDAKLSHDFYELSQKMVGLT
jgi:NAD(P)-dependent dehydrogenase (short-subunit alcohol dehydrogenase family)